MPVCDIPLIKASLETGDSIVFEYDYFIVFLEESVVHKQGCGKVHYFVKQMIA